MSAADWGDVDPLPDRPFIRALRGFVEAEDQAQTEAAAHEYVAAITELTGDPLVGALDLMRVVGETMHYVRRQLAGAVQ